MENQTKLGPADAFKATRIIHLALVGGLTVFLLAVFFILNFNLPEWKPGISLLNGVSIAMFLFIPAGYMISSRQLSTIRPEWEFSRKFSVFQTSMIIRWAMIEGSTLFSIVVLLLEEDGKQVLLALAGIAVLLLNGLTREKTRDFAKLSDDEYKALL